jgi:hypothetical protein
LIYIYTLATFIFNIIYLAHLSHVQAVLQSLPKLTCTIANVKHHYKVSSRMFATINFAQERICVRLCAVEQSVFSNLDITNIHAVPNIYGTQGWTLVYYKFLSNDIIFEILKAAYCYVAAPKLSALVRPPEEQLPYHVLIDAKTRKDQKKF